MFSFAGPASFVRMNRQQLEDFQLIESKDKLDSFFTKNKSVEWLGFDTEFVGEKRFNTRLCLIQVASVHGNYLIDPFELSNVDPFLDLIENPAIEKITHAGENDYRLLHTDYQVVPQSIFDTQVAAGFAGYKYPVSFKKLVETELNIPVNKAYTVTNWESRPFTAKQLKYAIDDVIPLFQLKTKLGKSLMAKGRLSWMKQELSKWEQEDYYEKDPHKEALTSNLMSSLNKRERVFLIRLMEWRRNLASERNFSREMILSSKFLAPIVKSIKSGKASLLDNRRIPQRIIDDFGSLFEEMYRLPVTPEENRLLEQVVETGPENKEEDLRIELLYLLLHKKCIDEGISVNLVFPRSLLKRLRQEADQVVEELKSDWRGKFIGEQLLQWMLHYSGLDFEFNGHGVDIRLNI